MDARPIYILSTGYFRSKDAHRLKVKEWRKIVHANGIRKKVEVAVTYQINK